MTIFIKVELHLQFGCQGLKMRSTGAKWFNANLMNFSVLFLGIVFIWELTERENEAEEFNAKSRRGPGKCCVL